MKMFTVLSLVFHKGGYFADLFQQPIRYAKRKRPLFNINCNGRTLGETWTVDIACAGDCHAWLLEKVQDRHEESGKNRLRKNQVSEEMMKLPIPPMEWREVPLHPYIAAFFSPKSHWAKKVLYTVTTLQVDSGSCDWLEPWHHQIIQCNLICNVKRGTINFPFSGIWFDQIKSAYIPHKVEVRRFVPLTVKTHQNGATPRPVTSGIPTVT